MYSREVDGAQQRVADAEVAVDGDGAHDECREGDVGRDEEVVGLAHEVVPQSEAAVLHVHRVGHDDEARDEVDEGEGEDEDGRDELVLLAPEDVEDEAVARRADEAECRQHAQHDVQLEARLEHLVRLQRVAAGTRVARHRAPVTGRLEEGTMMMVMVIILLIMMMMMILMMMMMIIIIRIPC